MKFVFLVGLPGSGKTHYGRTLGGLFLDDVSMFGGPARLKEGFGTESLVVVADPWLCLTRNRNKAEAVVREHHPECEVEFVFFENDPERCWDNVYGRDDRNISRPTIFGLSKRYEIPENVQIIPVWSRP